MVAVGLRAMRYATGSEQCNGKMGMRALTIGRLIICSQCVACMGVWKCLAGCEEFEFFCFWAMSVMRGRIVVGFVGKGTISKGMPSMVVGLAVS